MSKDLKTFFISSVLFIALLSIFIYVIISGINFGSFNVWSLASITTKYNDVKVKENSLEQREILYKNALRNLENVKSNFSEQRSKYEAISDETINIIKEATTKENYNIEYMWIKLGNYARANKLDLILIEPGGSANIESDNKNDNEDEEKNTTISSTTSSSSNNQNEESTSTTIKSSNALQIQLTGSYMRVADFVFDVENDKELRFRLDNISMDYVEGTTIRTTFDIKNLVINK